MSARLWQRLTTLARAAIQTPHHHCVAATKPDAGPIAIGSLADAGRSKPALIAENALPRQQLLIVAYLYIFIIGTLIGPLLLGIGLGRAHLIPAWATWALILRAPIQVAGFVTHIGLSIEFVTFGLLLPGSIPVARALLVPSGDEASQRTSAAPAPAPAPHP